METTPTYTGRCLWQVGEIIRDDDGTEAEIVDITGPFSFVVKRLDTGEVMPACVHDRHPPKGWTQINDTRLIERM